MKSLGDSLAIFRSVDVKAQVVIKYGEKTVHKGGMKTIVPLTKICKFGEKFPHEYVPLCKNEEEALKSSTLCVENGGIVFSCIEIDGLKNDYKSIAGQVFTPSPSAHRILIGIDNSEIKKSLFDKEIELKSKENEKSKRAKDLIKSLPDEVQKAVANDLCGNIEIKKDKLEEQPNVELILKPTDKLTIIMYSILRFQIMNLFRLNAIIDSNLSYNLIALERRIKSND